MSTRPQTPEDDLFPSGFATLNELCRTLAVGGQILVSPPGVRDEGYRFIIVQHMDRGAKFHVIALNDDSFIVHRVRQEYELLALAPRTPVESASVATGIFPACLEALNRLNSTLKTDGDLATTRPVEQDGHEVVLFFNVREGHAYRVKRMGADACEVTIVDPP